MQDRPTADELAEAVAHFLQTELAPTLTDARLRFRTLIAANLMAVLGRELRASEEPLRDEWRQLQTLLGRFDNPPATGEALRGSLDRMARELRTRIRAGEADSGPWAAAVRAYAHASVNAKLKIANPRFLERLNAEE